LEQTRKNYQRHRAGRALAGKHHRLQRADHLAPRPGPPSIASSRPISPAHHVVVVEVCQQVVHAAIDRIRARSPRRPLGRHRRFVDRARLQAQQRATVCRLFLTRWWISWTASDSSSDPALASARTASRSDGLPYLPAIGGQQAHLVLAEGTRAAACARQTHPPAVARVHRHGQDRLVLVLGRLGIADEARVEVRRLGDLITGRPSAADVP
jgi:hypothetical protein